jgi:hypothetical protein
VEDTLRSKLFSFAALTLIVASVGIAPAHAQDDVRKRGDKACGGDSRKMCSQFFGNDMAVLGCLQQNRPKLSGTCTKFLVGIGQLQN